jgi:hypothetical protein
VKKAYEDPAWLMKPSEIEVDEISAIVKLHSSTKCAFEVERFEKYMKLLSDPNLVRSLTYLTLLEQIRILLFGQKQLPFIRKL